MKFDYVIGNPPYGKGIVNKKHTCYNNIGSSKLATHGFIYKSITLMKIGAELSFIIPTNFLCLKSGEKIRQYMHENGRIISIEIFEDNPFVGYAMPGTVCIIRYKKGDEGKTLITRHLYGKKYTTEQLLKDIVPMSFGNESYTILNKVLTHCETGDINFVSVNKLPLSDKKSKEYNMDTLVRINGGTKLVYNWSSISSDYSTKKIIFSHMLNLDCALKIKKIRTVVMENVNVSGGLSYITCNNEEVMVKWLESKIFFICLLQLLDNVHMSDTNIGRLLYDFQFDNFSEQLKLSKKEMKFIENFTV